MEKNSGLAVDYEPMNVSAVANTPTSGVKRPADNHPDPSSEKRSKTSDFEFTYPTHAGPPPPATVKLFYDKRKAEATGKVNKAVVIEDVVNAVASHENDSIKEVQKIAQLKKSSEGKALCELARTVVKECNKKVVIEINNIREEMKSGGAAAKKELEDLERYLRRLKSEEKGWLKSEEEIKQRIAELATEKDDDHDDGSIFSKKRTNNTEAAAAEEEAKQLLSQIPDVDGIVQSVSEDITLQADRIGKVLRKCKVLIGESEDKRREVFNMFAGEGGVQFSGYEKVDDAKSLIRGLLV